MLQTVLELLLALLLPVTCGWCAVLHRRLQLLRVEQEQLGAAIDSLGAATDRAGLVVAELKEEGARCAGLLDALRGDGAPHREQLGRLLESAARLVTRLERENGQAARLLALIRMEAEGRPPRPPDPRGDGG